MPDVLKTVRANEPEHFSEIQQADLGAVRGPYVTIALVVLAFLAVFALNRMPGFKSEKADAPFFTICGRLAKRACFTEGLLAQLFYVGAQIMCWTFIIHYGMEQFGLSLSEAQGYNIIAMLIFVSSRFICTFLMRYISPSVMLLIFSIGGFGFTAGAIFLPGQVGLISLVLVSACMSLMFPTIYGIALRGLKIEEAKIGSAFLIMSIVGGAVLTKLQGSLITNHGVRISFWLPAFCFVMIALFAPHAKAHAALFDRVSLDLGGGEDRQRTSADLFAEARKTKSVSPALLEKIYDAGRYMYICSAGELPPNLQGIWTGTWSPAWSGDFTLDTNIQLAMKHAHSGNLGELMEEQL